MLKLRTLDRFQNPSIGLLACPFHSKIRFSLFGTCAERWLLSEAEVSRSIHYSNILILWLLVKSYTFSSACSRSAIRSSTSSIPTE